MQFDLVTIFPEILDSYFNESILGRARSEQKISIFTHDIRKFAINDYGQVDDKPYGGGVGMLLMFEPLYKTLKNIPRLPKSKVVLLSAKGKIFTQSKAQDYTQLDQIIFICGRYEGVDERIMEFVDEEIRIGDYVLTGGELGAAVVTDAIARLIPGVLGKDKSNQDESHSIIGELEYPQYTRPESIQIEGKKLDVPKVLLSGDHAKIAAWQKNHKKQN